jgi:cyanophycinase
MARSKGRLVIVGGGEDRKGDKVVLARFVELAGGKAARVVVLTTASQVAAEKPEEAQAIEDLYDQAFRDLGAKKVTTLHIHDRAQAGEEAAVQAVMEATGVFMTGGAQERLASIIGGTPLDKAMHDAYREHGAVIGGTSAGASAISQIMVLGGPSDRVPIKGSLPLAPGLGYVGDVIIDQHFSERQRLARLMSVIALNPAIVGIGVDEDTALVITPGRCIEVVGSGTVTVVDGSEMAYTNFNEVGEGEVLALTDVRVHMLPAGFAYDLGRAAKDDGPRKRASAVFGGLVERMLATC